MKNNVLLIETDLINGLQHKCPICKKIVVFKENQIGYKPKTRLVVCNTCNDRLKKASLHRVFEYLFFLLLLVFNLICVSYDKPFSNTEAIIIIIYVGIAYICLMGFFSTYYLLYKRKISKKVE